MLPLVADVVEKVGLGPDETSVFAPLPPPRPFGANQTLREEPGRQQAFSGRDGSASKQEDDQLFSVSAIAAVAEPFVHVPLSTSTSSTDANLDRHLPLLPATAEVAHPHESGHDHTAELLREFTMLYSAGRLEEAVRVSRLALEELEKGEESF